MVPEKGFRSCNRFGVVVIVLVHGGGPRQDEEAVAGQPPPLRATPDAAVETAELLELPAALAVRVEDAIEPVLVARAVVHFLAIVTLVLDKQSLDSDICSVFCSSLLLLFGAKSLLFVKDLVSRCKRIRRCKRIFPRNGRQPLGDCGGQLRARCQTRVEL